VVHRIAGRAFPTHQPVVTAPPLGLRQFNCDRKSQFAEDSCGKSDPPHGAREERNTCQRGMKRKNLGGKEDEEGTTTR
jgi:hypothetical protein